MRIGVLSDTHNHYDPRLPDLFAGVDHILHAGDIGLPWLILELRQLAPVTAVLGNNDAGLDFRESELIELDGRRFLLHHIVEPRKPAATLERRLVRENPEVVVFGHSHRRFCETVQGRLFFNPGYAGKPRFGMPRSVAILHSDPEGITAEFLEL